MDLTKRQQEILDFIEDYGAHHGYPPTVRDIGKAVGLASSSTVHQHLANLEQLGMLRRDPSKPRALELLHRVVRDAGAVLRPAGLPLLGTVAAGQPVLAEENIEDYVSVPQAAGGDDGTFLLRVRGESMRDAGIIEGDLVVVRSQEHAADGEIVVALVGEEATVKRYFREADHVRLQPENAAMEPIRSSDVRILGRVVGVMRSLL
ncbi:MAG: transcriptional repressor LexA [Solirubrobacteraceae bacterium]